MPVLGNSPVTSRRPLIRRSAYLSRLLVDWTHGLAFARLG